MGNRFSIRFMLPAPDLRDRITTYYVMRIGPGPPIEDRLQPEWAHIRFLRRGNWKLTYANGRTVQDDGPVAVISGTLSRSARFRATPSDVVGVGLLPLGWACLTPLPVSDFIDTIAPLEAVCGVNLDALTDAFDDLDSTDFETSMDAWARLALARTPPDKERLLEAHAYLNTAELATTEAWAAHLGCSTRQVQRLSQHWFGLPPKSLLRRQRFLRTLARIRERPAGEWAHQIDEHYFDQAHFVRDFHFFMGLSPTKYLTDISPFMIEAANARAALLGDAYQGLHRIEQMGESRSSKS